MNEIDEKVALVAEQGLDSVREVLPWVTPDLMRLVLEKLSLYVPKLVGALLILIVGFWIVRRIRKLVERAFLKTDMDEAVEKFLESMLSFALKIVVVLAALNLVGIPMASFLAILGAAGLAVGLALQGSLSNFAGGVLILIFKPFKLGDFIEAQGHAGTVKSISVVATTLLTGDNKTVIIPNGGLANGAVVNFSTQKKRRLEWNVGIAYADDIDLAKDTLEKLLDDEKRIIVKEGRLVGVSELGDNAVVIKVRAWVKAGDYWDVNFAMWENIKKRFDAVGLNFPFPQRDVHLIKD